MTSKRLGYQGALDGVLAVSISAAPVKPSWVRTAPPVSRIVAQHRATPDSVASQRQV
jgi:hypothetical protein